MKCVGCLKDDDSFRWNGAGRTPKYCLACTVDTGYNPCGECGRLIDDQDRVLNGKLVCRVCMPNSGKPHKEPYSAEQNEALLAELRKKKMSPEWTGHLALKDHSADAGKCVHCLHPTLVKGIVEICWMCSRRSVWCAHKKHWAAHTFSGLSYLNERYCDECANNEMTNCASCGGYAAKDDPRADWKPVNRHQTCKKCQTAATTCAGTSGKFHGPEDLFFKNRMSTVKGKFLRERTQAEQEHYNTSIHLTGIVPVDKRERAPDRMFCEDCFYLEFFKCAECRAVCPKMGPPAPDGDDSDTPRFCDTCEKNRRDCAVCNKPFFANSYLAPGGKLEHEEFCDQCKRVERHDYRAEDVLQFHSPACHKYCNETVPGHVATCSFDGRYLGVELEVECGDGNSRNRYCAIIKGLMKNKAIVKHDGSLRNGLEIVTAPGWIGWQKEAWDAFFDWQAKARLLRSHDTTTCGLHVHVSRNVLTDAQISRAVHFLHSQDNRAFIQTISGRYPNRYQDYLAPKLLATPGYSVKTDNKNRYTALNLCNRNTVEFRLFRGTLNKTTFFARLEFTLALLDFTKTHTKPEELTEDIFLAWVENHEAEYSSLAEHLERGELIARKG